MPNPYRQSEEYYDMAKPRLTEFLLKLATDASFYERFANASEGDQVAFMEVEGLDHAQRNAVLSCDPERITHQVIEELEHHSSLKHHPGTYIHLQLHLPLVFHTK